MATDYVVGKTSGGEISPPHKRKTFQTGFDVLAHTHVSDVLQERPLVTALTKDSIIHGLHLLIDNRILSVPLYEVERQRYVGFLDITDVVHQFLKTLTPEELRAGYDNFKSKFAGITCKDVSDISGKNPWRGVDAKAPLQAVVDLLNQYKVHRIPVIDSTGELYTILSQSRVVQYLANYIELFPFASDTVGNRKLGYRDDVVVVPKDSLAKDAFEVMCAKGVSGVGIVDDNNQLIGTVSTSDLRGVVYSSQNFERLNLSVGDFLALVRATNPNVPQDVLVVTPSFTIADVAKLFQQYKVHRLFVVDTIDTMKTIGVISLYDFLLLFSNHK